MQNDEKKVVTIADLSDSVYDSFKENTQLLKKIKFIKSYKHSIRQEANWLSGEIEIQMDELYSDSVNYYIRMLRSFCAVEGNGRPSAYVWEYLYRIDELNAFDYESFLRKNHIGTAGAFEDFYELDNTIKIVDSHFPYGEYLPKEFYEAVGH